MPKPRSKTQRDRSLALLRRKGVARSRDLAEFGVARTTLQRLESEGALERVGRGLYRLADANLTEFHDLAAAAARVPRGVICLLSALRFQRLRAYPREAVIAEKLHAVVLLRLANTRMKDLYDICSLAQRFEFDADRLADSIAATFARRRTEVPEDVPIGLSRAFADDAARAAQWRAFVQRRGASDARGLAEILTDLRTFLVPVMQRVRTRGGTNSCWAPGGPWRARRE